MAGKDYGTLDTIGIVSSRRLAETVMDNIQRKYMSETQKYMKSKHNIELYLKDGTRFIVCPMSEASKGRRLTYALIDKNIHDTEFLNNIVYPMCAYCKEDEIFYIADSKDATNVAFDIIDLIRESKFDRERVRMSKKKAPMCPGCGAEMVFTPIDVDNFPEGAGHYECFCKWKSPFKGSKSAAYNAAQRRYVEPNRVLTIEKSRCVDEF